jgi:hypothetical protein
MPINIIFVIIRLCQLISYLYSCSNNTDYITAAYFFNARGNELEKTPLGMFRLLLYQLLDQDHLLYKRFIPMFLGKQKKHGNA